MIVIVAYSGERSKIMNLLVSVALKSIILLSNVKIELPAN